MQSPCGNGVGVKRKRQSNPNVTEHGGWSPAYFAFSQPRVILAIASNLMKNQTSRQSQARDICALSTLTRRSRTMEFQTSSTGTQASHVRHKMYRLVSSGTVENGVHIHETKLYTILVPLDTTVAPTSTLFEHTHYKDDEVHGELKEWDENGQLVKHSHYKEGKLHGECMWWMGCGSLMKKMHYKDGVPHGECIQWQWWMGSGILMKKMHYKDGVPHGECIQWQWLCNGTMELRHEYYVDGKKCSEDEYKAHA